jgi:hypothetical protein
MVYPLDLMRKDWPSFEEALLEPVRPEPRPQFFIHPIEFDK